MIKNLCGRHLLIVVLMVLHLPARISATDYPSKGWILGPSVGVHWGSAKEIVYPYGKSNQNAYLSLLTWDLQPVYMVGIESRWESGEALGLNLRLRSAIPLMPVGKMTDYDWLYKNRDWSHWSLSDVTQRWGFTVDAITDWHLCTNSIFQFRLGVGYHLDWWAWKDNTKDSIYSTTPKSKNYPVAWDDYGAGQKGFRDVNDAVPMGVNAITYDVAYHVPMLSFTLVMEGKVVFLSATGRVGPVLALSHDHHLLRKEEYGPDGVHFFDFAFGGPWLDAELEFGFRTSKGFSLSLRTEYAWLNETRGHVLLMPSNGKPLELATSAAGFAFERIGVSLLCAWTL